MTREELLSETGLDDGGVFSKVLDELEACGFIRSYMLPRAKTRGTTYQLIDNFTLFYFQFMTLVTPHGLIRNEHANDVQSEVTLDDFFRD